VDGRGAATAAIRFRKNRVPQTTATVSGVCVCECVRERRRKSRGRGRATEINGKSKNGSTIFSRFSSTVPYTRAQWGCGQVAAMTAAAAAAAVVVGGGDGFSAGTTSTTARGARRAEWSGARAATLRAFSPRAPAPPRSPLLQYYMLYTRT